MFGKLEDRNQSILLKNSPRFMELPHDSHVLVVDGGAIHDGSDSESRSTLLRVQSRRCTLRSVWPTASASEASSSPPTSACAIAKAATRSWKPAPAATAAPPAVPCFFFLDLAVIDTPSCNDSSAFARLHRTWYHRRAELPWSYSSPCHLLRPLFASTGLVGWQPPTHKAIAHSLNYAE